MSKAIIKLYFRRVFVAMLVGASLAEAQTPKPRVLKHRLESEAKNRWAKAGQTRIKQVMQNMRNIQSAKTPLQRANIVDGTVTTGTLIQVLVPIAYADDPFVYNPSDLEALYYGPGSSSRYSLPQFYLESSRGVFSVKGKVANIVRLPKTKAAYVGKKQESRFAGVADSLDMFIKDVLAGVDSTIDLSPYADGSDPSKRLAALVIVQVGQGGECYNQPNSGVWAHRYTVSDLLGQPYATRSMKDGKPVLIDDYIVNAAEECGVLGRLGGAGTVIHETGHLIGLPDLYNTNSGLSPVGQWDLMASGSYYTPDTPSQLGAWSRFALGWTQNIKMNGNSTDTTNYSVNASVATGEVGVVEYLDTPEFLLLETRFKTGSDLALPGEGLLIWKIDPRIANEQSIGTNTVNTNLAALGVGVIQADNLQELEKGVNEGDKGDIFDGSTNQNKLGTGPFWISSEGNRQGEISSISYAAGTSQFRMIRAVLPPAGTLTMKPDSLPRGIAGLPYRALLFLSPSSDSSYSVSWSADSVALKKLGLSLKPTNPSVQGEAGYGVRGAVLSGTLSEAAKTLSFPIKATVTRTGGEISVVSKTYQLLVTENPKQGLERLVQALISNSNILSALEVVYYDAVGNQNGVFDLGDIVLGLKKGLIQWTPGTIVPKP